MPTTVASGSIFAATAVLSMALWAAAGTPARADDALRLRVSDNGRHLVDGNGEPFFWLGDTGWALFSSLDLAEADEYLENRRQKGFNVVQCIIAHWSRRRLLPTPAGHLPWIDGDPATPNPAFFEHVDGVLEIARSKGIVLALLPAWGDFVTEDRVITTANAFAYGRWLGERYRETANIVWVLGGDRPPTGYEDVFRELARGLAEGDGGGHLMTYHPRGGSNSSEFFHEEQWLDFNMIQSGHGIDAANYERVLRDYNLTPVKPTVDGEPRYENIIHGLRREGPRIDDYDARKAAYHAVLSGAMGHTYGANGVFQFYEPGGEEHWQPILDWRAAMDLPGAFDVGVLKRLMEARRWERLAPDPTLVVRGQGTGGHHIAAARSRGGGFAYLYLPRRIAVTVDLGRISGEGVRAAWFNPRTGESTPLGELDNRGHFEFLPPTRPHGPDYVLVLESAAPDTTPPAVARVIAAGDPNRVTVVFTKPVEPADAETAANYAIQPGIRVEAAQVGVDGRSAVLTVSDLTPDTTYTLVVGGIRDLAEEPNLLAPDTTVPFSFTARAPRVVEGLLALYGFTEGGGGVVHDLSGAEEPAHLRIPDATDVEWRATGLSLQRPALLSTAAPPSRIVAACRASNELTVEAWLTPANTTQDGPARIVTLSADTAQRNFTLGQDGPAYEVRLRTTGTSDNGIPAVRTAGGTVSTERVHVVYTRSAEGVATVYLNGAPLLIERIPGDLANWSSDFRLALGNELTADRPWLGEYHLVALYGRALRAEEVALNFAAGPEAPPGGGRAE